jgi:hypothetical protein
MSSRFPFYSCLLGLMILLAACSPAANSPTPTAFHPALDRPPLETQAAPVLPPAAFKAGESYSDNANDMPVSFLDVLNFRTRVDEQAETVEVVLRMRDIPDAATLGQVTNLVEYFWAVYVYLDPSTQDSATTTIDYYFGLNTMIDDPYADVNPPIPGTPVTVPFHELFEVKSIYSASGSESTPQLDINPDLNTLTLTGHIPGITSHAEFSFSMDYYDGTKDRPDADIASVSPGLSTPLAEATQAAETRASSPGEEMAKLIPAGEVHAYPGPEHYAGDVLTFEIPTNGSFPEEIFHVSMTLDDAEPRDVEATYSFFRQVIVPRALDTTNLVGRHTVRLTTADGELDETYSFEVLPADQRPANEANAAWTTKDTDCCTFHYISGTAAERDIDFIAENFEQAAQDFEALMGEEIGSNMTVYFVDRMLNNGGFGGGGTLIISYTDRYFGPTVGSAGLQTLARHEFSHAAGIGFENAGDGVEYNYEGLALYVAGGHYKPEPFAQRGAALYDLGHYAPVTDFIPQHELSYLHAALILTYIVDTYGEAKLWEFLSADDDMPDEKWIPLGDAIQVALGIPLAEFDEGFRAWLEKNDPGEQLDDLRLTVELQDARREYQTTYSPQPLFLVMQDVHAVRSPENLSMVLREARAPANIAIELLIANAQRAILSGAYPEAEELIKSIKEVVSTGSFEDPLAREYLAIVLAMQEAGHEVLYLSLQNGRATVQVTNEPPNTTVLNLEKVNGIWQISP